MPTSLSTPDLRARLAAAGIRPKGGLSRATRADLLGLAEMNGLQLPPAEVKPKAKPLTAPMRRLVKALETYGDVDTIRDGGTVSTVVALMDRGILREATPRSHGKGSCHHYPATTPEQVWDEAHDANEALDRQYAAVEVASAQIAQDIQGGNYTLVMGEPVMAVRAGRDEYGTKLEEPTGRIDKTAIMSRRIDSLMNSGAVERETDEQRAERHALSRPLIEAFNAIRDEKLAAPSLADDVAALRADLNAGLLGALRDVDGGLRNPSEETKARYASAKARLDRIAAQVPQRAMSKGILSRPLWQHETCRHIDDVTPGPGLTHCNGCGMATDKWQALYTLSSQ